MNNVLQVKIPFQYESNKQSIVANNLRTKDTLSVSKIEELISDLKRVLTYFADKKSISQAVQRSYKHTYYGRQRHFQDKLFHRSLRHFYIIIF